MRGRKNMAQREELLSQRRKVDFDTYDITVDELIRRSEAGRIEVAPSYQRQFRWDVQRQSRLIESVTLGIPVPPLFMATNVVEGVARTWEVVDGLQRLMSLIHFGGGEQARQAVGLDAMGLRLTGLELLSTFNGAEASDLPPDVIEGFLDRPLKAIVLNDKSDLQVRYDLFERLNTGGVRLTDHEIREAVFPGEFINLLNSLVLLPSFQQVVVLPSPREKDGTRQDFALRFFAFLETYREFNHSVRDFLLSYAQSAAEHPRVHERQAEFERCFDFLAFSFPQGISRGRRRITPVNLYEGVAVGAALALRAVPDLSPPSPQEVESWITSDELRRLTTGATNDRRRVMGRIEFCRDWFVGQG